MQDVMARLIDVPMARMFLGAGLLFLFVAVVGRIEGKIEPGNVGRIGATVIGLVLMAAGIAMHFIEGESIRDKLRENVAPLASHGGRGAATAAPAQTALPAPASEKTAIKVIAGTYGRNCNAKPGNATPHLARACDGRSFCDFKIDVTALEDPAPACDKDFAAEWKCGTGATAYTVSVPAGGAKGGNLILACSGG
jgi:hypothetical protein